MFTKILIVAKIFISALPLIFERIGQVIEARIHQYTYNASDNPRNIIVIGGSFGGLFLATELANSIPTGYRVVLIEKRSHFNFTWIFPRVSVVTDHEHKAFIPYGPIIAGVPEGSLKFIRGVAVMINESSVTLMDGTVVEFEYLAVATGTTGSPPWCAATEEKREGMENFRRMQREIRDAKDFVVVGGGAVGVELAADAKCMYPEMNVSLIHSRSSLLNSFGPKLHDYSMKILNELGVNVHLGERVSDEEAAIGIPSTVTLKSGRIIPYDLLIKCTGQKPASGILAALSPSSISSAGTILVRKSLQIADPRYPNIYSLGDVAETGGVRMGRAAGMQATVVASNINRSIKGKSLKEYHPLKLLEDGIDLTLGLTKGATYFRDKDVEFLIPGKKNIALGSEQTWRMSGARPFEDKDYDAKIRALAPIPDLL